MLSLTGWGFNIAPADIDESAIEGENPEQYVLRVAETKAKAVKEMTPNGPIIIAADTTVADEGKILGKPTDEADARHVLRSLRDRNHQVYTAISIYDPKKDRFINDLATTDVPMRNYSDDEIEAYLLTGDPFDKAGSYAIQHSEFRPVDKLEGCYANVVGLPLCHLLRQMLKMEIQKQVDLPSACQKALNYDCLIFKQVLRGNL